MDQLLHALRAPRHDTDLADSSAVTESRRVEVEDVVDMLAELRELRRRRVA